VPQLHRVDCPTLVVVGQHDPSSPPAAARVLPDHISAGTLLFMDRGFDEVTADEIAAATVFNHFLRKEDMFFDLDKAGRDALRDALRRRDVKVDPIKALRRLAHQLVRERSPFVDFSEMSQR